jgi:hypothetical protein
VRATVAAIFNQPAPLAATDETKRPRQIQMNANGFFLGVGSHVEVLSVIQVYDFVKCVREL